MIPYRPGPELQCLLSIDKNGSPNTQRYTELDSTLIWPVTITHNTRYLHLRYPIPGLN